MEAIVLAGGLGTRLRSVVADVPKPMAPVGGRPFLEHQLDYWIDQGIARFVISVGYRHEIITGHFRNEYRRVPISYAIETEPLGTGGGLLAALPQLGSGAAFLLLNGDTYFKVSLPALQAFHETNDADCTLALFQPAESGRYMGLELAPGGRIASLKSGAAGTGGLANGGVYLFDARVAASIEPASGTRLSLEDELLPRLHAQGRRLFGYACGGSFIDIGVPHDYARAGEVLGVEGGT